MLAIHSDTVTVVKFITQILRPARIHCTDYHYGNSLTEYNHINAHDELCIQIDWHGLVTPITVTVTWWEWQLLIMITCMVTIMNIFMK